jgi:ABC-type multidrug transport system fused ATPase/permease subunit
MSLSQFLLGVVDLVAIGLIGVVTSMASRDLIGNAPGDISSSVIVLLRLDGFEISTIIFILATLSLTLLIIKSMCSYLLTKKLISFLLYNSSEISQNLFHQYNSLRSRPKINLNLENMRFNLTEGTNALMVGVIGGFGNMISDLSTLLFLFIGLTFVDVDTTLILFLLFSLLLLTLIKKTKQNTRRIAENYEKYSIHRNDLIQLSARNYREIHTAGLLSNLEREFGRASNSLAQTSIRREMMQFVGKYTFETLTILVSFGVLGYLLSTSELSRSIATFAMFLASIFRIMPAALRIYQGVTAIRVNRKLAENSIGEIVNRQSDKNTLDNLEALGVVKHTDLKADVVIENLDYFLSSGEKLLSIKKFVVEEGEFIGIYGRSGAGKSTLLDLLLGLLEPTYGRILIGEESATNAIKKFPGQIAYVPQNPALIRGTLRDNLTFGNISNTFPDAEMCANLFTQLGLVKRGSVANDVLSRNIDSLSGGEFQRFAIARALLTQPKLLILDEPVSALDTRTRKIVAELLRSLRGKVTIIVVSHQSELFAGTSSLYELKHHQLVEVNGKNYPNV